MNLTNYTINTSGADPLMLNNFAQNVPQTCLEWCQGACKIETLAHHNEILMIIGALSVLNLAGLFILSKKDEIKESASFKENAFLKMIFMIFAFNVAAIIYLLWIG